MIKRKKKEGSGERQERKGGQEMLGCGPVDSGREGEGERERKKEKNQYSKTRSFK